MRVSRTDDAVGLLLLGRMLQSGKSAVALHTYQSDLILRTEFGHIAARLRGFLLDPLLIRLLLCRELLGSDSTILSAEEVKSEPHQKERENDARRDNDRKFDSLPGRRAGVRTRTTTHDC